MQEIFKALSLEVQKKKTSFLGQHVKKSQLLAGLDRIQHDGGHYLSKILQEMDCVGPNDSIFQPCRTLQKLDAATKVQWHGFNLIEKNLTSFHHLSQFKNNYIQTLRRNVEFYLPDDSMMNVFRCYIFTFRKL